LTDDPMVAALKAAGAIILAKSNTPEFGAGSVTYNDVWGSTFNPWDVMTTPGGSSGGSAAALAAGQIWGATGTDVGGSLRIPASFCGIIGMRTTQGLVPQVSPLLPPLPPACDLLPEGAGRLHNVSAPMARNVPDMALLLDAVTQGGNGTTGVQHSGEQQMGRFTAAVQESALAKACQGITKVAFSADLGMGHELAPVDAEVAALCATAAAWIANTLGVAMVGEAPEGTAECKHIFRVLRAHRMRSLAPLVMSKRGKQFVKQEVQEEVARGMALQDEEVTAAAQAHVQYMSRWQSFLADHQVLMTPCVITPPFDAKITWLRSHDKVEFSEYTDWLIMTYAVSLVNVPALSLPVGLTSTGLPVGLQIIGRPGEDAALLAVAAAYERAHGWASLVPLLSPKVPA